MQIIWITQMKYTFDKYYFNLCNQLNPFNMRFRQWKKNRLKKH
ncbi:hypothetical protein GMMP15_1180005 [Candidatus Magnetomoraceae bacterium gMMP-15]